MNQSSPPEFMADFRKHFYDFQTIDDHIKHLAQLEAKGLIPFGLDPFIEGYGNLSEMGVVILCQQSQEEDII